MPNITFVLSNNSQTSVNAPVGRSLMRVAVDNGILGIVADCGGLCACSTCQVLVDDAWLKVCEEADELERAMLEHAYDPQANSRLACRIQLTEAHDGMVVTVPARQF
jgi:2Fe-2S ferredoxin